jgi:predicted nucleic-acid-binding Zn-ribbon protein
MSQNSQVKRVGPKNLTLNRVAIIGGAALLVGGLILIGIAALQTNGTGLFVIGAIAALFGGADIVGGLLETRHYHRTHCKQCGHLLEITDMTYGGMSIKNRAGEHYNGTDRKEDVEFDCKCPNCGCESHFTETFTTGTIDKNGNTHIDSLNALVKKYWKYKK